MTHAGKDWLVAWHDDLARATTRFRLVFITLGYAHSTLREDIVGGSSMKVMNAKSYLHEGTSLQGPQVVALDEVEQTISPHTTADQGINLLRERVMADMDRQVNFVLISRLPRIAYPNVPGSSLLEDAKFVCGPLNLSRSFSADGDPVSILPVHDGSAPAHVTFEKVLLELGSAVLASLDHALFESMLNPESTLGLLSSREFEALQGAGLAIVEEGRASWSIPNRYGDLRDALANVLSELQTTPESVPATYELLWALERLVRGALRSRATQLWGADWRSLALAGDLPDRVLSRATGEAYEAAKSIEELRDPFEWLTLGELLETRMRREYGQLGIEPIVWRRLASEVLPVRNRLSHMRLLRDGDEGLAQKWLHVVRRKISVESDGT